MNIEKILKNYIKNEIENNKEVKDTLTKHLLFQHQYIDIILDNPENDLLNLGVRYIHVYLNLQNGVYEINKVILYVDLLFFTFCKQNLMEVYTIIVVSNEKNFNNIISLLPNVLFNVRLPNCCFENIIIENEDILKNYLYYKVHIVNNVQFVNIYNDDLKYLRLCYKFIYNLCDINCLCDIHLKTSYSFRLVLIIYTLKSLYDKVFYCRKMDMKYKINLNIYFQGQVEGFDVKAQPLLIILKKLFTYVNIISIINNENIRYTYSPDLSCNISNK